MSRRQVLALLGLLVLTSWGWLALATSQPPPAPPVALIVPTPPLARPLPTPTPPLIEADAAVTLALRRAQAGFPPARLVGPPSEVRGRRMPLVEADRLATGGTLAPAPPNDPAILQRPTWLIVIRGQLGVEPASTPPTGGRPPLLDGQLVLLFDAIAATEWMVDVRPLNRPVPVASLPRLTVPTGLPATPPSGR